ncbi:MAG: hypothetical protein GX945_02520, partial [Lentisphaerae bacterium]|nr:hypothetical protein [Lentisphaerota bacterium]
RLLGQSALLLQDGLLDNELPSALTAYICGGCVNSSLLQPFFVTDDGGCCMEQGARADVLSTVLVAEALLMASEPDLTALATARDYLLAQRAADGYWRLCSQAAPGDLRLTARVVGVLARIQALSPVGFGESSDAPQNSLAALLVATARQVAAELDASAPSASVLVDMAWLLRALCHLGCWEEALALYHSLLSAQHADGSWGGGDTSQILRTTCAVVGALRCFSISRAGREPDLAVPAASLRLQTPVEDTAWRFSATVFNDGQAESLPCGWELHHGSPAENTLLAQGRLPALIPRDSCKVQVEFTLATAPSVLYLLIDPDGESGDAYRLNNMARLVYCPPPKTDSLLLWLSPLTIRSEGASELLLLRPGSGVIINAMLLADGPPPAVPLRLVLLDNGRECFRQGLSLENDFSTECRCEWFPDEGWHELALRVLQGEEVRAERLACVEVCYQAMLLRILSGPAGEAEGLPQFTAGEYVTVRLYVAETAAAPELWVANEHNERLPTPLVSATHEGRYTWHTGVQAPGRYRVYARTAGMTSAVSADFTIMDSCELRELSVLQPDFVTQIGVGDTLTTPVSVSWTQLCNSSRQLQLSWTWTGPDGVVLAKATAPCEIDCAPGALTRQLSLPEPATLAFPTAGSYLFAVEIMAGETVLKAERSARAMALPSLTVEQSVQPESVGWEACEVAVCSTVKLHAGAGGAGGMQIPAPATRPQLLDAPGERITILLQGIHDADGQIVEKGTLAARVLYGCCGKAAPGVDASVEGVFSITNGNCHISYTPGGSALSAGMWAPVIMSFFDPQTEQHVGCIEMHLEGSDETMH